VRFDFSGGLFASYVRASRECIAIARQNAAWQAEDAAIDDSSPFELRPATPPKTGALLIHGLSDSPYQMRDLARWLSRERGMLVRALLLPGHGTVPGDMLRVRWQDWARAVRWGLGSFRGEVQRLVVVGVSTGAALAIDAVLGGEPLDGLVLLSPAIGLSPLAALAGWHRAISWALPRTAWLDLHADRDPVRYESLAHNAVQQVHDLVQRNRQRWPESPLAVPMFSVQSDDDSTVSAEATLEFFRHHRHPASRLLLYTRHESNVDFVQRVKRIAADDPALRAPGPPAISFSHLAPPIAPDNPRYGRNGSYRNCLHYESSADAAARSLCHDEALFAASPAAVYGEKTLVGEGRVLRRLTWNPHFEGMLTEIGEFLDRVEEQ
jgi:alpha-beta hydrolase superfamily lysophospholipase